MGREHQGGRHTHALDLGNLDLSENSVSCPKSQFWYIITKAQGGKLSQKKELSSVWLFALCKSRKTSTVENQEMALGQRPLSILLEIVCLEDYLWT